MNEPETPDLLNRATEAACVEVWKSMWGETETTWPDDCVDPELFRREELEALLPALRVLLDAGALTPAEEWRKALDDAAE